MTLLVIGGGAAGIFCAVNAAVNPSLKVIVAEKSNKLLSKVRVSGGGRCNVTHACFSISDMVKNYPRGDKFVRKSFHHFFTTDTIAWFDARGVKLKTESDGRMFPETDSSETIIHCLMQEVNRLGVEVLMRREVVALSKEGERWKITFAEGSTLEADYVVVACGGYPKSSSFQWLIDAGHSIEEPVPSLYSFNMPGNSINTLMGVSVSRASVKVQGTKLSSEGPLLVTHWGLSGPAILRLSAWGAREFHERNYDFRILVNWLPDFNEQTFFHELNHLRSDGASQFISKRCPFNIPQRLWEFLVQSSGIAESVRWADLSSMQQNRLVRSVMSFECEVKGKTTYKEEFVTAGGIRLSEIEPSSMESRIHQNLFFAGEILNVDGITGGFNFQHAWTSGWVAAKTILERMK